MGMEHLCQLMIHLSNNAFLSLCPLTHKRLSCSFIATPLSAPRSTVFFIATPPSVSPTLSQSLSCGLDRVQAITEQIMTILDKSKLWELTKIGPKDHPKSISVPPVTLASVESLTMPLVQEVVLLADFRCKGCQERVADIMSRMNGESESVVVSVLEKKVTVTCRYPRVVKFPRRKLDENYINPVNKFTLIMRLFMQLSTCQTLSNSPK